MILIVEDHRDTALILTSGLVLGGYEVDAVETGSDALDRLSRQSYDLIILDLGLPDMRGEEVLATLRAREDTTLMLILSARGQLAADRIEGLNLGADDYLSKPFELAELLARVQALLRRVRRSEAAEPDDAPDVRKFGQIEIQPRRRIVRRGDREVELPPMQYALLMFLVERRDRVVSHEELLAKIWGLPASVDTRTLETHIYRLRKALEDDPHRPRHIITVHGFGYRFEA